MENGVGIWEGAAAARAPRASPARPAAHAGLRAALGGGGPPPPLAPPTHAVAVGGGRSGVDEKMYSEFCAPIATTSRCGWYEWCSTWDEGRGNG